ncbi:MAG TPA: hypothetical protein VFD17_01315, partial [Clostridia bacterium]|nr:hypothetical protein [Clostridia bacterium]
IALILLLILIIFRERKSNSRINYHGKQNKKGVYPNNTSVTDNKTIINKIAELEQEILKLGKENNRIVRQHEKNNFLIDEHDTNNDFEQVLNYNLFKEKNSNIINLYRQGAPKEEIAKVLNKSIREVEMVINLTK